MGRGTIGADGLAAGADPLRLGVVALVVVADRIHIGVLPLMPRSNASDCCAVACIVR